MGVARGAKWNKTDVRVKPKRFSVCCFIERKGQVRFEQWKKGKK